MSEEKNMPSGAVSRWKMPKWGWALFAFSLALNLLVLGSVIGMRMSGHHHGWKGGGLRSVLRELPKDQREDVRAILKKHRADVRPLRRELRKKRKELAEYTKSPDMTRAELERRLDVIDAQRRTVQARLRPMLFELTEKLNPEVRGRVLEHVLGGKRRHRRRSRRRHRE